MSNASHVRFAAEELGWVMSGYEDLFAGDRRDILESIIRFHCLDINPAHFDLVDSIAERYCEDIASNRSIVCE